MGSKRNIESLAKCPTINYTAFSCNNMSKFFHYQILADGFVLNLKKTQGAIFPIDILSWGHKILPDTLVRIPIWIQPVGVHIDSRSTGISIT